MTATRTGAVLDRITYSPPAAVRDQLRTIPWPTGLAPLWVTESETENDPLPKADVLVVTYTAAEGHALADVLTAGHDTTTWTPYRNGWPALRDLIVGHRAPSLFTQCAGVWASVTIGGKKVVLVKSDLHPATDGEKLPMAAFWSQMLEQVRPSLVLTTGTAGGVGADTLLGDVVVSRHVHWDCQTDFEHTSFAHAEYEAPTEIPTALIDLAQSTLIGANPGHLPPAARAPRILLDTNDAPLATITTDFFAFDDAEDHYGLRRYDQEARAVEMDDAALGVALAQMDGDERPAAWFSVRNASDPQIPQGIDLQAEDKQAASIYQRYGYWTTVNSVLTCWALTAASA